MGQSVKGSNGSPVSSSPSIAVDRLSTRTVAPHGMTGPELNRLSGAVRLMELHCRPKRGLYCLHTTKPTRRSTRSDSQECIPRLQGEQGLQPYIANAFRTRGGFYAHIASLVDRELT